MLTRPQITSVNGMLKPFDATENYILRFNVVGGNQVFKNEIEIYNNDTNVRMFQETIPSFEFYHTIPLGTLVNGTMYKVRLRTYDSLNNTSAWSDYVLFKCLSKAIITIPSIINGEVKNQTELFTGNYVQTDNSELESFRFYLYNSDKNIILFSPEIFIKDELTKFEYEATGIENGKEYYAEFKTVSVDGLEGTSKLVKFKANYIQPTLKNLLTLENQSDKGSIKVSAKVVRVLGHIGSGTVTYENGYINLLDGSVYIDSENGFSINDDFTLQIWCKDLKDNDTFITLFTKQGQIEIAYKNNKIYVYKKINNEIVYMIYSDEISITDLQDTYIYVQHKNGLFNLETEVI